MPITQDRFLTVLNAAKAFQKAFQDSEAEIKDLVLQLEAKSITQDQFTRFTWGSFMHNTPSGTHVATIAFESNNFRPSKIKFNTRERLRQERLRRAKGGKAQSAQRRRGPASLAASPIDELTLPETPEEMQRIQAAMKEAMQEQEQGTTQPAELPIEQQTRSIAEIQPKAITDEDLLGGDFSL